MDLGELLTTHVTPEHELSFRLLADCLPQLIWTCDASGVHDYLSRRWEDYTGRPVSEQLGMGWLEQVHPEDRTRLSEAWQRCVRTGDALRIDFRIRRYDGIYRWFDTRAMPLRDAHGNVVKWFGTNTDIQEQLDIREALLLSEQRFRTLYHSAAVSIWLEDWTLVLGRLRALQAEGVGDFEQYFAEHPDVVQQMLDAVRVVDVNDWTLRVFRAQRKEQLLGSLRWMYDTPVALQGFTAKLISIAQGERTALVETELSAFDGSKLRVLSSVAKATPNNSAGLVVVSRVNITARFNAEEAVRQQQALLDRMSRLAKVGGWAFDVGKGVGSATPQVAEIHGLQHGESLDFATVLSCFREPDRQSLEAVLQRAMTEAAPFDIEAPLVTPAGVHKWIRAQGVPIVRDGQVVSLEGATQDITDRKHAELQIQMLNASLGRQVLERTEQLEQARSELQNILDALPSMIAYWDKNLFNRFGNRRYREFYGVHVHELDGRHFREIFGDAVFNKRHDALQLALQGHAQQFETVVCSKDGLRSLQVQMHYMPDVVQGVVQGIYVLLVDVTDRKKAEQELRAANHELEAFAYAVAHDLRAPLRALSGFSSALLEDCGDSLDEAAKDFALEINKAGHRMGELLEGLLALSRSTQGTVHYDRVNLSEMAVQLSVELQRQDPQRRVQWRVESALFAFGDSRMLEVVMRNLLGNAWKYTAQTEMSSISFDSFYQDGRQWFRVADNGAGFDMAHADRLFKPFQRLHRQDEFIGIGIGLATVQRIVHRHGGDILAMASPGHGASFCFTLEQANTKVGNT